MTDDIPQRTYTEAYATGLGRQSYRSHKSRDANPFDPRLANHTHWINGYDDAYEAEANGGH